MDQLSILFAIAAGMLSFFSPCIFPLLPAYVANLTGSYVSGDKMSVSKKVLMVRSLLFILGFTVVFMMMGASASMIGQFFAANRGVLEKVAGLLIILFGLQTAGLLHLRFLMFQKQWEAKGPKNGWHSFVVGLAFGTGWTPCVGLALSSILLLAGSAETMYSGIFLLLFYSLGLGVPFLLISLLITRSLGVMKKVNKWLPRLSLINGWILIAMGLLLFTGQLQKLSAWLAQFAPVL
ncbi:cytochrome c biogenesis CcdA family protein [Brevibacillus sp. Leaf182]|uniref:cytochrome c biogenesis CcdA family protein n=1 Tax=Brevibacillus sp. Leaf182 TaxID=1736290 RepID=UPI0006F4C21C|nr:cytochrome c biogenesis protein CcdA [Brevibacillus sp. Leaf182]RAT98308.1 cytochrome c biogenesis protein CcdA [Brevibacillus sp. Leaf182]